MEKGLAGLQAKISLGEGVSQECQSKLIQVHSDTARMHEGVSQFRLLLGYKGQRLGQVVFAQGGLEIGK